jgi:hypothetical protein
LAFQASVLAPLEAQVSTQPLSVLLIELEVVTTN